MGLYIQRNEQRSKLQERVAAELQEKARKRAAGESVDGVDDSRYIEGTKKTTSLAGAWIAIVIAVIIIIIAAVVVAIMNSNNGSATF